MESNLCKDTQMNASDPIKHHGLASSIMRPRPGPRRGSLRTVMIQPTPMTSRHPQREAVAVQGVLPLSGMTSTPAAEACSARQAARARRRRTPEFSDGEARQIARQVCRGVVEVLSGDRPANQLVRCTSERVYLDIARRSAQAKSRRRMTQERRAHSRVERVRIQRPNPRAIEVCARIHRGNHVHAMAARLEFISGRWTCVALEDDLRL